MLEKYKSPLSSERMEVYNIPNTKEIKLKSNRYKHKPRGVIVFLREIFNKLGIQHEAYWSSVKFLIHNQEFVIFQHTKKKDDKEIEWFYFADKFKGRNRENFIRRVKRFLIDMLGDFVKKVFQVIEKKFEKEFEEIKDNEDIKKEKSTSYIYSTGSNFILKIWNLITFNIANNGDYINVKINENYFDKYKNKFYKMIELVYAIFHNFLNIGNIQITIRKVNPFLL